MAKNYKVTITETSTMIVDVQADSREEAEELISDKWYTGEYILGAENFGHVDFKATEVVPTKTKNTREER